MTHPVAVQKMPMLEKRQRWLRSTQRQNASLLDSVPIDQHPNWPSHADMSSWPKRKWESETQQMRVKLRELRERSLCAGFVLIAEL